MTKAGEAKRRARVAAHDAKRARQVFAKNHPVKAAAQNVRKGMGLMPRAVALAAGATVLVLVWQGMNEGVDRGGGEERDERPPADAPERSDAEPEEESGQEPEQEERQQEPAPENQPISGEEVQAQIEGAMRGAGLDPLPFDNSGGFNNASDPGVAWDVMGGEQEKFSAARSDDDFAPAIVNCTFAVKVDSGAIGAAATESPGLVDDITNSLAGRNNVAGAAEACGELVALAVGVRAANDASLEMRNLDPCPGIRIDLPGDWLDKDTRPEPCR